MIRAIVMFMVCSVLLAISVSAADFSGKLASSNAMPADWEATDSQSFDTAAVAAVKKKMKDQGVSDEVLKKVGDEQADIIFCNRDNGFADNINIRAMPKAQGFKLPSTPEQLKQFAEVMATMLSQQLGVKGEVEKVTKVTVDGKPALRYQFPGVIAGTVSIQYMVESVSKVTYITLTCKKQTLAKYAEPFYGFVSSLQLK